MTKGTGPGNSDFPFIEDPRSVNSASAGRRQGIGDFVGRNRIEKIGGAVIDRREIAVISIVT